MSEPDQPFAFAEEREHAELMESVRRGRLRTAGPEAAEARRPWWRKKRWRLALALWLASPAFYALSGGPAWYAFNSGRISDRVARIFIPHYRYRRHLPGPLSDAYHGYIEWWGLLFLRHEAEAREAVSE